MRRSRRTSRGYDPNNELLRPGGSVPPRSLHPWGTPPRLPPLKPDVAAAVAEVYGEVDATLADATCEACGACCRFDRTRPVLFASALELAYLIENASWPDPADRPLLSEPDAPWRCPYQRDDACRARTGRVLGCRTYFCEPQARGRGEEVHDTALARLRAISDEARFPLWYGPVRLALARPAGGGIGFFAVSRS